MAGYKLTTVRYVNAIQFPFDFPKSPASNSPLRLKSIRGYIMFGQFIDADTHIVEDTNIWDDFPSEFLDVKPKVVTTEPDQARPGQFPTGQYWMVDGELYGKGGQALINYQDGTRNFRNPDARAVQMTECGVATQIIYPSIFLGLATKTARAELAMVRCYNRWMADLCSNYKTQFRFVAVPSAKNIDASVADMQEWKDSGACGLLLRGYEDDKLLNHRHFWPLYKRAAELDMPICIHIGQGSRNMRGIEAQGGNAIGIAVPNLLAFSSIVNSNIPSEFPNLKFGIIESGSEWAAFAFSRAARYRERYGVPDHTEKLLADGRLFITCEAHEDIGQIVKHVGTECLMLGTDYGHSDTSTELRAHALLAERNDIGAALAQKITVDNPRNFYGL